MIGIELVVVYWWFNKEEENYRCEARIINLWCTSYLYCFKYYRLLLLFFFHTLLIYVSAITIHEIYLCSNLFNYFVVLDKFWWTNCNQINFRTKAKKAPLFESFALQALVFQEPNTCLACIPLKSI